MEKTEWAIKNGPSRVHTGKIEHGKYRKKTRKTQKSTAQKKKRYATRTPRTAVGEPRCSRKVSSSYLL